MVASQSTGGVWPGDVVTADVGDHVRGCEHRARGERAPGGAGSRPARASGADRTAVCGGSTISAEVRAEAWVVRRKPVVIGRLCRVVRNWCQDQAGGAAGSLALALAADDARRLELGDPLGV